MAGFATPSVFKTQRSIQTCYELPHRIHSAKTYPVTSPNGSTIIIYGHENGVRLVWRGGRPFKQVVEKKDAETTNSNGTNNDVVMILDSDEEDEQSAAPVVEDEPEFEDEEDDSAMASTEVIQYLDLFFGTSGLRLAVPAIPTTSYKAASQLSPEILGQKIVFAIVCGDHSTRLVSLPLTPPSPASKLRQDLTNTTLSGKAGDGKWRESVSVLGGHHAIADGVSFTFTPQPTEKLNEKKSTADSQWNVLLATHSREISGLLLIYSIPIVSTSKENKVLFSTPNQSFDTPLQIQYLSSPAVSICFKPLPQPPARSAQLILADTSGVVKIYDPLPPTESGGITTSTSTSQGHWLLSLYPGFVSGSADAADLSAPKYGRKSIIDAKWILSGKAIIVLLADGEWGIWDIEGAGPKLSSGRQVGIKGGANTPFTISGVLEGANSRSSSSRSTSLQQNNTASKFAPMTPGTRRTAEPTLFSSRSNHHGITRGQLIVTRLASPSAAIQGNECVILWLQESYAVIPNIWSFWDSQARKSEGGGSATLFGGSTSGVTRMMKLESVNLKGERCTFVDFFPKDHSLVSSRNVVPLDILVTGEQRFVIASDTRGDLIHSRPEVEDSNQLAVAGGELDVNSIDQALSQMENGNANGNGVARRGVSFLRK